MHGKWLFVCVKVHPSKLCYRGLNIFFNKKRPLFARCNIYSSVRNLVLKSMKSFSEILKRFWFAERWGKLSIKKFSIEIHYCIWSVAVWYIQCIYNVVRERNLQPHPNTDTLLHYKNRKEIRYFNLWFAPENWMPFFLNKQ